MGAILGGFGEEFAAALSGGASRALPYIVAGVDSALSANEIGRQLTAAGLGIRRSSLLSIIRGVRGGKSGAAYQRGLSGNIIPDPSFFTGAQSFMKNKYGYIVKVTGNNLLTGEAQTQFITLSSANPLTNDQVSQYTNFIMGTQNAYGMSLTGFELDSVLVDPRFLP